VNFSKVWFHTGVDWGSKGHSDILYKKKLFEISNFSSWYFTHCQYDQSVAPGSVSQVEKENTKSMLLMVNRKYKAL
jgi:hypothetical protein